MVMLWVRQDTGQVFRTRGAVCEQIVAIGVGSQIHIVFMSADAVQIERDGQTVTYRLTRITEESKST